jgi:peptidoglycan/xylan/chitin deacetylase (PgdA/CDA1 family)
MIVAAAKKTIRRGLGLVAPAVWSLRPKPSLFILTYHRVLPKDHPDRQFEQPGMYVSPETLEMHLRVLKKHFEIVDLGDWVRRSKDGQPLPDRACAITFDDGWRDNYDYGFPILVREQVPATIFLVSDFIGSSYEFWPNRLAKLVAAQLTEHRALPPALANLLVSQGINVAGYRNVLEAIDDSIAACKTQSDSVMVDLLDSCEADPMQRRVSRTILDPTEIAAMRDSGYIRFGSHGRRHIRLTQGLQERLLSEEIEGSRCRLQQLIGFDIRLFCFPNGDYSDDALAIIRSHYLAAVTTQSGWNWRDTDPYALRRISIHEGISNDQLEFAWRVTD